MIYNLPPLPYSFDALEPHIDARTMEIHHDKHHAAYIKNLNEALARSPALADEPLEELLKAPDKLPAQARDAVRNNGGGHYNHSLFWTWLSPQGGGPPPAQLADRLKTAFGGFEAFREQFSAAALARFGSGWAWLSMDRAGKLFIHTTPNQDTPFLEGRRPLLGLDVWEHAYYLLYQNRRADYVKAFWNIVDWKRVNELVRG